MISERLKKQLAGGSQIRKMFEEGNRLKAIYGPDKVYDFSIGNPDLEPPHEVSDALKELANNPTPGMHGYMSNSGYESTRAAIAAKKSAESGLEINSGAVCMTVGAASAMNDVLHSLLDQDDEVIVIAPYFMEYNGYISNHGGKPVIVQTDDKFMPVISAIRDAITPRTKAIIINSPNNPSGVVYPASLLSELNEMLKAQDHVIHVISDEPYIDLVYDGMTVPCPFEEAQADNGTEDISTGVVVKKQNAGLCEHPVFGEKGPSGGTSGFPRAPRNTTRTASPSPGSSRKSSGRRMCRTATSAAGSRRRTP